MTSERKITANRANARASTGPKTGRGRARAAQNALRHALSLPVYCDPALSEEVEALAREIAGPGANAEIQEIARRIAEAQIDVRRVRYARHQFLSGRLNDRYYKSRASTRKKAQVICSLLRANALTSTPQGSDKFAIILLQEAKQLHAIDRYERRALSRRKFAVRAFDAARRRKP